MKRKAGNSSEISAFDKVQKKPKLAYEDESSTYLSNDGILKIGNPTYFNTCQSYNPMENPQFISNNITLPNKGCQNSCRQNGSCSAREEEKQKQSRTQIGSIGESGMMNRQIKFPPNGPFGMNFPYFQNGGGGHVDNNVVQMIQGQNEMYKGMHKELEQGLFVLYSMMLKSNQMLRQVQDKQNAIQDQVRCLKNENQEFKKIFEQQKENQTKNQLHPHKYNIQVGKSFLSTSTQLLEALYSKQRIEQFSYFLISEKEIDLPIYRQRNFGFKLKLVDNQNKIVRNSNYMAVNVALYTTSNPPRRLQMNTAGNNILKQTTDSQLQLGQCLLEKFQIRQVTSHYPNGWLFLIVTVKNDTPSGSAFSKHQKCATTTQVNPQLIKPFIISKLIVKAKKMK